MDATKPTEEQEELRSKLDYEGQLIWRFGQFFNACENGDGLKAERSLANIFNFLTRDLREQVRERSEYESPREIREDTFEPVEREVKTEDGETEERRYLLTTTKEMSDDYQRERHRGGPQGGGIDHTQTRYHNDRYTQWSDIAIVKYQKFGRHILDVLDKEGLLQETRRIGRGTEE